MFSLYDELAKSGRHCAHEPEFRAYHILLTMDTHGKYRRDESALSFGESLRLGNSRLSSQTPVSSTEKLTPLVGHPPQL